MTKFQYEHVNHVFEVLSMKKCFKAEEAMWSRCFGQILLNRSFLTLFPCLMRSGSSQRRFTFAFFPIWLYLARPWDPKSKTWINRQPEKFYGLQEHLLSLTGKASSRTKNIFEQNGDLHLGSKVTGNEFWNEKFWFDYFRVFRCRKI